MTLDQCDFCGEFGPDALGTAETYIRGTGDEEGGVETVRICVACATQQVEDPDERTLRACDLCGHVGFRTPGRADQGETPAPVYRNCTVMKWGVSLNGLSGTRIVCEDCTPLKNPDILESREDRRVIDPGEPLQEDK